MALANPHNAELAALKELEHWAFDDKLKILHSINDTLRERNFRLRDLRTGPYTRDDRTKLFSFSEQGMIDDLRRIESELVNLLPVRDILFDVAELKHEEKEAASEAFSILMGVVAFAVIGGLVLGIASVQGQIDWQVTGFVVASGLILFAWGFGLRKRDELRARRVWQHARTRAGF